MARRRRKGRRSMGEISAIASDSLGLENFLGLGDLGAIAQDAMDVGIMGLSGLAGLYVGGHAAAQLPWVKDQNNSIKGAALIVAGIGSAIGLKSLGGKWRGVAAGFGGSMVALGGYKLINSLGILPAMLQIPGGLEAPAAQLKGFHGYNGLAVTEIEEESQMPRAMMAGMNAVEVEEVPASASFMLRGLGSDMDHISAATL